MKEQVLTKVENIVAKGEFTHCATESSESVCMWEGDNREIHKTDKENSFSHQTVETRFWPTE